jgi:hypothetical protein
MSWNKTMQKLALRQFVMAAAELRQLLLKESKKIMNLELRITDIISVIRDL